MSIPSITFHPAKLYQDALKTAGQLWGIEPGYWDIWGNWHETAPELLRAILEFLGVAAGSLEQLNHAMEERFRREWAVPTPPVFILSENAARSVVPLRIPADREPDRLIAELEWEDGRKDSAEHSLGELETSAAAEFRGRRYLEKQLPLTRSPLGYHRLRVSLIGGGENLESETRLIVAPERAYLPPELEGGGRLAGLNVSLYGVRSSRSWGCGDFTDLQRLAGWAANQAGANFIGLNPLHAIHNRQPFNTSPYLPNCIFYQNFIYLDVERVADFERSAWARRLRASTAVAAEIKALNETEYVEYERVARLKRVFLRLAFRAFLAEYNTGTPRAQRFRRFVEQEGELLHRYAVYCALDEWIHHRRPDVWCWPDWPEPYQDPQSDDTRRFAREHWCSVLFYKYVEWQIDEQLAAAQEAAVAGGLTIGLFHDLALATDRYGADLWAHRRFFVPGCRVGAPPDGFSPKGQDWSFPPPSSDAHWADGYRLFQESIRKSCRHGGALRIDHVMRFFRLFWIPAGCQAHEGTYVRDRHEDLVRILALESVRNKVLLVGEDLGTVDPAIRETLARFGILSYRLLYFERDERGQPRLPGEYPVQALVSATTHDLPTLAGFWLGRDIEARHRAGIFPDEDTYRRAIEDRGQEKQRLLDVLFRLNLLPGHLPRSAAAYAELSGELHNAITGFLASTPSMLLALNQEDLTKETEQQNLPGTTAQYPNWRRKMRYSLEELESSAKVRDFVTMLRNWLDKTNRLNR